MMPGTSSAARAPRPTATSRPIMLRTICLRNPSPSKDHTSSSPMPASGCPAVAGGWSGCVPVHRHEVYGSLHVSRAPAGNVPEGQRLMAWTVRTVEVTSVP